jgi:hypothetical protein
MKTMFRKRWYFFIPLVIAAFIGFGYFTMYLWNWLMPMLFHLPEITFWQTIGLMILSRLILGFGSHHRRGHGHHCQRDMHEKWGNMTPEEREKFRENIHMHRAPWAHHHGCSEKEKEA